jgi:N-hydroxyarylamine O-acetyltransferase
MSGMDVAGYLARLGVDRPAAPDPAGLRTLQEAHLRSVPFENLSIHLGEPIVLRPDRLVAKLVGGRGGFCYELNGAFAALLTELGYTVRLVSAQVYAPGDELGPPLDHLALVVDLAGVPWLVDVGFGQFARHPLRLDVAGPQTDPDGRFEVSAVEPDVVDVRANGTLEYRLDLRPRRLADFGPTCWYHQTSPESHFTRKVTCSRLTATGRITLSGDRLIRTLAGRRTETRLAKAELLAAYRDHFGITLDRVPVPVGD